MENERFATPEDVIAAHQVVEDELGQSADLNFYELPKNKGTLGDGPFYGHSVLVRVAGAETLRSLLREGRTDDIKEDIKSSDVCPTLQTISSRICNETTSVCRVFVELTPLAEDKQGN